LAEIGDEPEEQRQRHADYKANHDKKVKGRMFAAVDDVAKQFSQTEKEFVPEIKKDTNQHKKPSEENKKAAKLAKRVHKPNLLEPTNKCRWQIQLLLLIRTNDRFPDGQSHTGANRSAGRDAEGKPRASQHDCCDFCIARKRDNC